MPHPSEQFVSSLTTDWQPIRAVVLPTEPAGGLWQQIDGKERTGSTANAIWIHWNDSFLRQSVAVVC